VRWLPRHIGWEPYVHLVWLSYLVVQPIFDPGAGLLDWLLILLMLAAFLPVYFWTWTYEQRRGRGGLWGVAGMALLGLVFTPLNSGSSAFFIYAAAAVGYFLPPQVAVRWIFGILALVPVSAALSGVPWPYVLTAFMFPGLMVLVIGGLNVYDAEKARANAKLRLAHEEIERLAKVAERERIGRDLHDLLGHTLSVITLKSELASKLVRADLERAEREMAEVAGVSRGALREVREAVRGLREGGLAGEVEGAKRALSAAGVTFSYHAEPVPLTPAQERTLALALREAVTNVVRHAQATRCTVRLARQGEVVTLTVEDDGCAEPAPEGTGLAGMRERVEALGGSLRRGLEGGTRLTVSLPGGNT
jgi:two-component system, NarL family, sensor histidine kinase DesK